MSALPPKADMCSVLAYVSFGSFATEKISANSGQCPLLVQ